jgi:uncharacterized membrane protein
MKRLKIEKKWYLILLLVLMLIGSFLRFYHLDFNSLWYNEAFTLFTASHTLAGIGDIVANNVADLASVTPTGEFSPPLFYYIEHFMLVFGRSEFILRFVPALLGILTIPVFYYIGKEFADENLGIVMAALLTVSPFHVYYSQEARAYTTMLFLFALAFYFLLVSMRTNKAYSWILFGFFSGLTIWTHYYAYIPIALLVAFVLIRGILRARAGSSRPLLFALSFVTVLIIVLPLLPLTINRYLERTSVAPWGLKGLTLVYQTISALSEYRLPVMALFCVLFIIGILCLWKTDKEKTILIAGLLVIPIIISIYLSEKMTMQVYYLFYLIPFFFLGIALSLKPLAGLFKGKDVTIIVILIFFLIQVPFLAIYYNTHFTTYEKEDWRGIAHTLEDTNKKGDYIIVFPFYHRLSLDIYYSNKSQGTYEFGIGNASEITKILPDGKNNQVYFVVKKSVRITDPDGSTIRWLQNNTKNIGSSDEIEIYKLNS